LFKFARGSNGGKGRLVADPMCTLPRKIPAREDNAADSHNKRRQRLRYPCFKRV